MSPTVIPFGPQHPVLLEPLQLQLKTEDEIVVEATPALGYVHRGLERLVDRRDARQMLQVVERVCGICSMIHSLIYCQAIEELQAVAVPPRARFLRVIWSELHRLQSHLLWLGLFADAMGFESLFMQLWKIREKILDINEATAGNRIILSVCVIGGVRRDLDSDQARTLAAALGEVTGEIRGLEGVILNDRTVRKRTCGKGVLSPARARELGCVGPTLRGSGISEDLRQLGYAAYGELDFEPVVERGGDCHARCAVRYRETLQSVDLIAQALAGLPAGEISVGVKGQPEGEIVARAEQPRGECLYYLRADGSAHLARLRIRTPTFANLPALLALLPGHELADVPVVLSSIDPCVSCTER
ncbi:MAG: nickel-dependent hydrogenase large subunit [Thermodesulfobacteriota bacterium]